MLRYRFDTLEQIARHLHLVGNQAVMFLRDHRRWETPYTRVLLELAIRATGQRTVVRGDVVARAEGSMCGSWLLLSDTRLVRLLKIPEAFGARRGTRVSTDQLVQIRRGPRDQIVAQLLDVGPGGLHLRGARGLAAGESCSVRLFGGQDLGAAEVMRVDGSEAGLRFKTPKSPAVARYVRSLQDEWARALELDHLPECCAGGRPIEPALPNLRRAEHGPRSR